MDLPVGTELYRLNGVSESALIVCRGDSELRLYQRVSLGGSGLLGSERFADVMPDASRVTAISLTGQDVIQGDEARRPRVVARDKQVPHGRLAHEADRQQHPFVRDDAARVLLPVADLAGLADRDREKRERERGGGLEPDGGDRGDRDGEGDAEEGAERAGGERDEAEAEAVGECEGEFLHGGGF